MLIVMEKSTHEKHLFQPLQTNNKQYTIAVTFLTGYNEIFRVTQKNILFYFTTAIDDEYFCFYSILSGAYERESLNIEITRVNDEDAFFTITNYPYPIKPNFSTLGSFIESSSNITGSQIAFTPDDRVRNLLGFEAVIVHEE